MRTYAAYLRKSRSEEGEDIAVVLDRHRRKLQETAKTMGIGIVDYYEEVVSGESVSSRPKMLALLDAVSDEQYYGVFCMDIDRLGRGDMQDQGLILSTFRRADTQIITPDKIYNLQDESDETMTEFKAFFARQEYKMIRKRMRRGTIACLEEGGYIANAPFGYEQCRINKKPSLRIIPDEAELVRLAFRMYNSGVGAQNIAAELNARGSIPRRNTEWNKNSVRYMLRNPVYTGKVVFNRMRTIKKGTHGSDKNISRANPQEKWLIADGLHDAIITQEEFDRAQTVRQNRYVPSKQDGTVHNQFAGVFRCSVCGKNIQTLSKVNGGPYMACLTPGCCAMAKEVYVEELLLETLESNLAEFRLNQSGDMSQKIEDTSKQIAGLRKELERSDARKARMYDLLEDGIYDRATFLSRMEQNEADAVKFRTRLKAAEEQLEKLKKADTEHLADAIENALTLWPESGPAERNRLLKEILLVSEYTKEKKSKPRDFSITLNYNFV